MKYMIICKKKKKKILHCLSNMLQYVVNYPMSFCLHSVVIQRSDATTVPTL